MGTTTDFHHHLRPLRHLQHPVRRRQERRDAPRLPLPRRILWIVAAHQLGRSHLRHVLRFRASPRRVSLRSSTVRGSGHRRELPFGPFLISGRADILASTAHRRRFRHYEHLVALDLLDPHYRTFDLVFRLDGEVGGADSCPPNPVLLRYALLRRPQPRDLRSRPPSPPRRSTPERNWQGVPIDVRLAPDVRRPLRRQDEGGASAPLPPPHQRAHLLFVRPIHLSCLRYAVLFLRRLPARLRIRSWLVARDLRPRFHSGRSRNGRREYLFSSHHFMVMY